MNDMDNLSQKLQNILKDEQSVSKLKELAEGLLSDQKEAEKGEDIDIAKILSIISKIKSTKDTKIELLYALKPHLSTERREKLDLAIKLLKLYSVLPLLKESNLLGEWL